MSVQREIDVVAEQLGKPLDRNIYFDDMPLAMSGSSVTPTLVEHLRRVDPHRLAFTRIGTSVLPAVDTDTLITENLRPYAQELITEAGIAPDMPEEVRIMSARRMHEIFDSCRYLAKLDIAGLAGLVSEVLRHTRRLDETAFKLTELRDHDAYTYYHSVNVCALGLSLFADFAESEQELTELGMGLLLHDIGKSKIDQRLLLKTQKLSEADEQVLARHVLYGHNIVRNHPDISHRIKNMILNHHERCDGSGYLRGLREPELSSWDMLTAVVDVFDAMTTARSYRQRLDMHSAVGVLVRCSGTQFSSRIVNHFLRGMGRFPVGTFVQLSSGDMAVVSRVNSEALALPQVRLLFGSDGRKLASPVQLDLLRDESGIYIQRPVELHAAEMPRAA